VELERLAAEDHVRPDGESVMPYRTIS
jgi:hypothetical protein